MAKKLCDSTSTSVRVDRFLCVRAFVRFFDGCSRPQTVGLGVVFFIIGYWGAPEITWREPYVLESTALDQKIPFIDLAVWFYLLQLPLILLALWLPGNKIRARVATSMALSFGIACAVFFFFPTTIPRSIPSTIGLTGVAWQLLYAIDTPNNALPSLHAAFAVPAVAAFWCEGKARRVFAVVCALLVMAAALMTKQHFVIDLSVGLCLGLFCCFLAFSRKY